MNSVLRKMEVQRIISTVLNSKWNTDYVIRYVTVEISKLVQREVSFFRMNDDEKINYLERSNYENSYPYVICKSLHELIRDVLDYLGIKSDVVLATNTKVPLYALIVEGEKGKYYVDALYDLFRSQYNIQPVSYGNYIHSNNSIIKDKYLVPLKLDFIREMDLDLGIISSEYFSDYINRVRLEFVDRNRAKQLFMESNTLDLLRKKIEFISDNYLNNSSIEGPLERVGLHVYLRNNLFNKSERKYYNVKLSNDNKQVILLNNYCGCNIVYEEVKENGRYKLIKTK